MWANRADSRGYVSATADQRCTLTLATQPEKESEVSDVKASRNIGDSEGHSHRGQRRLARGDMLSVILISILLNLTQLGAKPIGQAVPRASAASAPSQGRNRRFRMRATKSLVMVMERPEIQHLADTHAWHCNSQEAEVWPF
jgi:hypothetical protein